MNDSSSRVRELNFFFFLRFNPHSTAQALIGTYIQDHSWQVLEVCSTWEQTWVSGVQDLDATLPLQFFFLYELFSKVV